MTDDPCSHDSVSCQKLILDSLAAYEDGTMPEPERSQLKRHLEMCPPCLSFLNTYRATGRTLKMLKPREIPCDLARAVIAFVKARQGSKG
jgi:anti-sigma factor RsiW